MGELQTLPNIGAKLEQQLCAVGIPTIDALYQTGAREAWLRILAQDPSACLLRLSSLEGAVRGIPKNQLDEQTKASLRDFYHAHKKSGDRAAKAGK